MARAATAGPSMAKRVSFSGFGISRPGIPGHAKLLAHPAYQKLLAAEPTLRRLIPVLIVIFLAIVGLARFLELFQQKTDQEHGARQTVAMIAAVASAAFARPVTDSAPATAAVLNTLADALPQGAIADGRRIYVTDGAGMIVATAPRMPEVEGRALTAIIGCPSLVIAAACERGP